MHNIALPDHTEMSVNIKEGNMERVLKFKREDPEQFHCLVKMHLSFILEMNTDECDCSFLYDHLHSNDVATPKRKGSMLGANKVVNVLNSSRKGVMEGATLTMEGVCQIFQIIQYLDRNGNIEQVGLFRKTGNLQKQKVGGNNMRVCPNLDLTVLF